MFKPFRLTLITAAALSLSACLTPVRYEGVSVPQGGLAQVLSMTPETRQSVEDLTTALRKLSPSISEKEAKTLAREAHIYPMHLANVWEISSPPILHNVMRNYNKREYGLCIDWTYAMRQRMRALGLDSFDWHWGIANQGSDLLEHSTLVATAKGQPFESGIILDPWRNSGKLFWARIGSDPRYKWSLYDEPEGWTPSRLDGG